MAPTRHPGTPHIVHDSAEVPADDLAGLSPTQLERTIVTAEGRHLPARDIAWLRCRELGCTPSTSTPA